MQRMRVAYFVAEYHRFTGSQRQLLQLVRELPRSEVDPIAIFPGEGPCTQAFRDAGLPVIVLEAPKELQIFGKKILHYSRLRQAALFGGWVLPYSFRVYRLLRRLDVALLHCNTSRALLLGSVVPALCGCPVVLHVRGRVQLSGRFLGSVCDALSSRIVLISATLADGLTARGRAKAVTIPESIDPNWDRLASEPTEEGASLEGEKRPVVVTFASITPFKGYHHLIEAARIVSERAGENAPLFLAIGATNEYSDDEKAYTRHLHELVAQYKLTNWRFLGWRANPYPYYRLATAVVLPSVIDETLTFDGRRSRVQGTEGFGQTVLEAHYLGKPVVATAVPGVVDQVVDGLNGLLVQPGDAKALAEAIWQLLREPDLARRMGKQAREMAIQRFPHGSTVRGTLALYASLQKNSGKYRKHSGMGGCSSGAA